MESFTEPSTIVEFFFVGSWRRVRESGEILGELFTIVHALMVYDVSLLRNAIWPMGTGLVNHARILGWSL